MSGRVGRQPETRFEIGLLVVALAGLLPACEVVGGYETFQGKSNTVAKPDPCAQLTLTSPEKGGDMVPMSEGQNCFWIDKTEVKVSDYEKFREASPDPLEWSANDSLVCGWKGPASDPSHDSGCIEATASEISPFQESKPIRCVDWCDALAFCNWAGKRLCASEVGFSGVTSSESSMLWTSGCTDGNSAYPYGGKNVDPGACNIGLDRATCNTLFKGPCGPTYVPSTLPLHCKSPSGAYDMVGNVAEWVSNCGRTALSEMDQLCTVRGGSYQDTAMVTCTTLGKQRPRGTHAPDVGFRCCATQDDLTAP